ncbi:hypothetical protein DFP72DRAFT_1049764 [Ephemerocybe angulata]|uniref:Uncharacterized protein n=1 Tax=Ephemerocybe angulata TaxID=980116 RepID=A0A8H6HKU7_9AGAR|nr:hypothetical protein DFP72DRAFT_1049764 [Tulosesus angulatus]
MCSQAFGVALLVVKTRNFAASVQEKAPPEATWDVIDNCVEHAVRLRQRRCKAKTVGFDPILRGSHTEVNAGLSARLRFLVRLKRGFTAFRDPSERPRLKSYAYGFQTGAALVLASLEIQLIAK